MKRIIALVLSIVMLSSSFCEIANAMEGSPILIEDVEQGAEVVVETMESSENQDDEEKDVTENQPETEKHSITGYSIVLEKDEYYYTGEEICPVVKVLDVTGEEVLASNYIISYEDNVNVGNGVIIITGTGSYLGEISRTFAIKAMGEASSLKTTPSYGKIKIEWEKVDNADGYQLYRKQSGGSYKKIATVKGESKCSYTDSAVRIGSSYVYKMRAYKIIDGKTIYGDYTKTKTQKSMVGTPQITSILRKNYKTLQLKWTAVSGASGYRIYRSTSENSGYTRIKTVYGKNTLTYSDQTCSCGVRYYYKVCAFRTVGSVQKLGQKSDSVTGRTQPPKVNFTLKEPTYTSVTLKWKKSTAAHGYKIYRSTSKSSGYKLIKTVKSGSTLQYKDTGLTKHKVYYYKIRPYRIVNGKYVYGSYSDIYAKPQSGWRYKNGYKLYYNAKGSLVKDVRSIIGKQDKYLIKVNKKRNTVTIYAEDSKTGEFNVPVVAFICSAGKPTPLGTFSITEKYRWKWLIGPSWGQWSCRYKGGKLFHSVYYLNENDPYSLGVSAYNDLGTLSSHGCIRLTARDAKWIYDNCDVGTKVVIYESATSGPFGKPTAYKLASWHTWDPTDPNVKWKCRKYGCH